MTIFFYECLGDIDFNTGLQLILMSIIFSFNKHISIPSMYQTLFYFDVVVNKTSEESPKIIKVNKIDKK